MCSYQDVRVPSQNMNFISPLVLQILRSAHVGQAVEQTLCQLGPNVCSTSCEHLRCQPLWLKKAVDLPCFVFYTCAPVAILHACTLPARLFLPVNMLTWNHVRLCELPSQVMVLELMINRMMTLMQVEHTFWSMQWMMFVGGKLGLQSTSTVGKNMNPGQSVFGQPCVDLRCGGTGPVPLSPS